MAKFLCEGEVFFKGSVLALAVSAGVSNAIHERSNEMLWGSLMETPDKNNKVQRNNMGITHGDARRS